DSSQTAETTTRMVTAWIMQQKASGYPGSMAAVAADRAIGTAIEKARPIRPPAYDAAFRDLLAHELAQQVDWMERQVRFLAS
ncbi:MAG: hypothetical protein Q8R28_21790, partial [Dehalococcoidia bacterium]|nr:hypothetical protein [Dehalococcoidia bacterium]